MRLGISGGPGIGKTTLATSLTNVFDLPLIPEGVEEWLRKHNRTSPHTLSTMEQNELQSYCFEFKILNESLIPRFVSDRTVIDGIVTCDLRIPKEHRTDKLVNLISKAHLHARTAYDLIIILEFGYYGDEHPLRAKDIDIRVKEHSLILEYVKTNPIKHLLLKIEESRDVKYLKSQVLSAFE